MQYLDAMGVDMFVPRFIMSAALAPRQAELPQKSGPVGTPAVSPVNSEEAESRVLPERASNLVNRIVSGFQAESRGKTGEDARMPEPAPTRDTNAPVIETPVPKERAQFSLALWRISDEILVVDSRRPKAALPTEALLSNILFQSGLLRQPLPRAEFLNWPMAGGFDQSWDAAGEMVQAFLEGRLLSSPVKQMVIMGDDAGRAILQQDVRDKTGSIVAVDVFTANAVILPSLADILYQPELKKTVWQGLQKFFNQTEHGKP